MRNCEIANCARMVSLVYGQARLGNRLGDVWVTCVLGLDWS